jgi:transposase
MLKNISISNMLVKRKFSIFSPVCYRLWRQQAISLPRVAPIGDERTEAGKIVVTAKNQNEFFKKSILTPEMFAYTLTSKYVDHIPYYRLSKVFSRFGLEISRATFCNWTIGVYQTYKYQFSFLKEILLSSSVLGIDETTLQVLNEKDRSNTSKSYMWLLRGGTPDIPILKYIYRESRSAEFLVKYLQGYEGIIQTDGFSSYDTHLTNDSIIHAGCLAHARRKFESEWKSNKNPFAGEILNLIRKIYFIEREINESKLFQNENFYEIKKIRQEKSKPLMEEIFQKLTEHKLKKNISVGVGNAVKYTLNQWDKLVIFLEHGVCKIDNNLVENGIRPFVLGRKNWLFSGSPNGADASAFWYSIIETAKANKQEPYKFILHILKALPNVKNQSQINDIFLNALSGVY